MRFASQSQQFFRYFHHLARPLELVKSGLYAQLNFFRNAREILLCLRELRLPFADHGALFASVENVESQMDAECPEIARKEWNIVLIAIAGKCFQIRQVLTF